MRITPHGVIESMGHAERVGYFRPGVLLAAVRGILEGAVLFQFPDVHGIEEHCSFAVDLYERGLFRLPFPVTALALERDLGPPIGRRGSMIVLIEREDGKIGALSCSEVDDAKNAVPISMANMVSFEKVNERSCDVRGHSAPLVSDAVLDAMYLKPEFKGMSPWDVVHHRTMNNVLSGMGLVVMLMSKGVSTEHVPPQERLNKARAKNRKPLIGDRYVVSIDLGTCRTICNADGTQDDITGHKRGSPRPHWRRGHFRTLNRGGEERIIPVAPSLIAANADSVVTQKVYSIKKGTV